MQDNLDCTQDLKDGSETDKFREKELTCRGFHHVTSKDQSQGLSWDILKFGPVGVSSLQEHFELGLKL